VQATWSGFSTTKSVAVAPQPEQTIDFAGATSTGGGSADLVVTPTNWTGTITVKQAYSRTFFVTGGNGNSNCVRMWLAGNPGMSGTTVVVEFSPAVKLRSLWASSSIAHSYTVVRTFADTTTATLTPDPSLAANTGQVISFGADWTAKSVSKVAITRLGAADNPYLYLDDFIVQ
jgi:hypothetical protein